MLRTSQYVVDARLTVSINPSGWGSVTPDYNGRKLQIGTKYSMTAEKAPGFGFSGWTSNGVLVSKSAQFSFVMVSGLTLAANFVDITPPKCSITYPTAGHSVSNSPINATVRATDNVGVAAVHYQLNGGAWYANATTTDETNWTLPDLALTPGANTLKAYAVDTASNTSKPPASVTFTYVPPASLAPASLSGLVGTVEGAAGDNGVKAPYEISFGAATFAVSSTDTNQSAKVGNYTYTFVGTNSVVLDTTVVAPPNKAGQTKSHLFIFTNLDVCTFTNSDGSTGYITFAAAANLVPSPSAIETVQYWDTNSPVAGVRVHGEGVFTNYSGYGTPTVEVTGYGTYAFVPFSPLAALLQLNFTDPTYAGYVDYTVATYSATNAGASFSAIFDNEGNEAAVLIGGFDILSSSLPPAGLAPMSIAGQTFSFTSEGGHPTSVTFGAYTLSKFDAFTNDNSSRVGDYTYMKTGPNTAQFSAGGGLPPPLGQLNNKTTYLTFASSTSATGRSTNSDGSVKTTTFTISTASSVAPTSLAGKTATANGASGTFGADGAFTFTKGTEQNTGTYTYAQYSPVGGMVVITWSAADGGGTTYCQLQFTSASAGTWYLTQFDSAGNLQWVLSQPFTLE